MWVVIFLFIPVWFAFAIFEFSFEGDIFKAYTAREAHGSREGLPEFINNPVKEYRIANDKVVEKIGVFINEYENCKIFDTENWNCHYSDKSAEFGVKQGEYFMSLNFHDFPHLASYGNQRTTSRFEYVMRDCQWDATGGINAIICLIRPFTT